ncbi:hypothetical protein [Hymenobacter sp.]|jgi:hypothetical protein|uniref:hypothetical protein n=1 Tax=Hymenobacter sp. TaxID=1898978 RepID=UPI002ED832DD
MDDNLIDKISEHDYFLVKHAFKIILLVVISLGFMLHYLTVGDRPLVYTLIDSYQQPKELKQGAAPKSDPLSAEKKP